MGEKDKKILIVEDEFINRNHLKQTLKSLNYSEIFEAQSADEAIEILDNEAIDISILDINLDDNERDGIWIADYINSNLNTPFIFLTAYHTNDIMWHAIQTIPHAYLIKPFNGTSISAAIELAIHTHNAKDKNQHTLTIKENNLFIEVNSQDIIYLESVRNYMHIYTSTHKYKHRSTIKNILLELPEKQFFQTHRGFIVNSQKIDSYSTSYVYIGDIQVPITQKYYLQLTNNRD